MSSHDGLMVFTGNANPALAHEVVKILGIPLGKAMVSRFSDGEIQVEIQENVRGEDVFIVQSTSFPANDNLMELLICIDALRRASAKRITAVVPYFGYARQDRKPGPRTVKLVTFSKNGSGRPTVKKVQVFGNERVNAGGMIKRQKSRCTSARHAP